MTVLRCGGRRLDLSTPKVMGILNVTPDSFSDGGVGHSVQMAVDRAAEMVEAGAAIIDVGGESTRPGAAEVSEAEELDRVIPIIESLTNALDILISVDTSKSAVIRAAIGAGAELINDVRALQMDGAIDVVANSSAAVCLMHMQGSPQTMQLKPEYGDVVAEVGEFLNDRCFACEQSGIARDRILVDPGFGFGKSFEHNLSLLARLDELVELGRPLLFGASRKGTIGALLDAPVDQRLVGSVSMALMAVERGARIVRVHDVRETVQALTIFSEVSRRS